MRVFECKSCGQDSAMDKLEIIEVSHNKVKTWILVSLCNILCID